MKLTTILVAAFSLAFLGGCDRGEPRPKTSAGAGSTAVPKNTAPSPSVPSSDNASTKTERQPVQGQVDPKQGEQRKDFQHPQTGGK
jgi:hypothetical protein